MVCAIMKRFWDFICVFAPIKTVLFNLHYLPFADAVKCPIFIYKHTRLVQMNGTLIVSAPLRTGMIKIGHYVPGTQDERYQQTTWEILGRIEFVGNACIGRGTNISVGKNATMTVGDNLTVSGNTEFYCHHRISIGDSCTLSWGILMMDTDFHAIKDNTSQKTINAPRPIHIGNHVWIGSRVTVLKGVRMASNTIIAAASVITKSFDEEYCVIGGSGKDASILRHNVQWEN